MGLTFTRLVRFFQGFSTGGRKTVDNSSPMGAKTPAYAEILDLKIATVSSGNITAAVFLFVVESTAKALTLPEKRRRLENTI